MSSCEKCFYLPLKNKLDKGVIDFFNEDGSRNDYVFTAFRIVARHFNLGKFNNDCPLGENGCPAKYREAVEKLNPLEQK